MPRQRLSSTDVTEYFRWGSRESVRFDAGELDHLGPLFGFVGDKLAEVRRRACEYRAAEVSDPRFHLGIGEASVDLLVELVDDLGRRVLGRANAR